MSTYSKKLLSVSAAGRGIMITGSGSPGAIIHTIPSAQTPWLDEVWIWAQNNGTGQVVTTIEFGVQGSALSGDRICCAIPENNGLYLVVPGFVISNSGAGVTRNVRAYASTTGVISLFGFVNSIS